MKALILTYYWPPSGGSGVQRWMYFARYLGEFGIEPTVITVDDQYASYPSRDESLNEKISHVRVFRTKTLEPLRFYSFLKSGNARSEIPQGNVGGRKKGTLDKLATWVRANFFIPDARVGWNRYAYGKSVDLLKREKFDVIITTGPPHSTHLVGMKLKERFGVKWIADFRDPWTEVYYNELFKRTKRNDARDRAMEMEVLRQADHVLTVGPSMQKLLAGKIPGQAAKITYIYNGYDSEKLDMATRKPNRKFTICYVGILSSNYPYQTFIEALKKYLEKSADKEMAIHLTGRIESAVIDEFRSIDGIELSIHGNVPHLEALETMINADLLLLILPVNEGSKILVSGKLLEYLASGTPILGIMNPDSDAADLIRNYATGKAFSPKEIDQVAEFIKDIRSGSALEKANRDVTLFERKNTARQLSELIKRTV